jgi:hypothetical protein
MPPLGANFSDSNQQLGTARYLKNTAILLLTKSILFLDLFLQTSRVTRAVDELGGLFVLHAGPLYRLAQKQRLSS